MFRLFLFNLILTLSACAQGNKSSTNKLVLSKMYTQAIKDFIKVANKKNPPISKRVFYDANIFTVPQAGVLPK